MKNKLLKFFRDSTIFLVVFGVLFSNIPFNVLTSTLDGYIKTRNIVDQAWNLKQNKNVVDNFSSFRNLLGKIKVYEAQAAISFVGKNTASGTNTAYNMSLTALTGGIASSPTEGDIVVVINAIANTANGNPGVGTAGYTESVDIYQGDTYDTNLSVSYKIMSASPDTAVSCNPSSSGTIASDCVAMVFRGIDIAMPLDVARTTAQAQNSEDVNCPAITPVTPGAIVLCAGSAAGASVDQATPTAPSGYSGSTYIQTDPGNSGAAVASYKLWSGSGAEDPAAYVMDLGTASANSWAAATLALRPKNNLPSITVSTTDSPDPVTQGSNVTFSATATDSDSNNWYLAVCTTNAVTPGSGGSAPTCNVGTYCVSGSAVASGSQNTCAWTSSGSGAQNWYAFACDDSSFDTKCSSVDSTNSPVTVNVPSYTLTVGATGTQTSVVDSGTTTAAYLGGAFTFVLDSGSATLDSFIISEMGSTTANTSLTSVDIQTDTDGAYPGSTVTGCTGLTFNASQKLTCTPSGGLSLSSATTRYVYVVVNTISSGAAGGETVEIEITNAATEVSVTGATNGSSGTKAITGATTIRPYISSITYPRTSPQNGGEIGQSVTINGAGFGTSCNGASNKVEIASAVVSCTGTTFSATSISITDFQYSSGDSYGGTGASGLLVTVGNATTSSRQTFYVYPSVTGVSVSEAREGDTVATISGNHFGTAEGANGVKFDDGTERTATVNGAWSATSITNVVVPTTISDSVDTVALRVYQGTGGLNTLSSSTSFVLLPEITGIIDDFGGADDTAREYDADDNAANNTTADLKDGEIEIGGKHFGGAGTVTILGQTAAQAVVGARCGGSSYTATCITARVSTTTSDSLYTGNVVVQRTSDSKNDSLSGFRVLPRITGFTPTNAPIGDPATVDGNHFCQNGGACPGAFDATDNYVIFNSNATATAFTSWSDTAMATAVPTGASTGNVFLRSNGYNSNAKSFTVNVPTPADPSNLKQSRNSGFTNLITIGEYASSTPVYFSVDTSSGITGGTMYLQTELRLTGSAFTSSCSGNSYCFENGGSAYSGGTITLTTSTTTPTTTLDDNYHWQARVCYNKNGTHNISCSGTGDNPSNNWISFGTDPDDVNEVDFKLDITAPTISIGSVTTGQNGATIPWDTNELATSQVEYGTDSGLSGSSFTAITDTPPATSGKTSGHSVALSNLNCNTTYYFRARSKNKAYIEGTSTISNFPTSGCPTQPGKTTSFHIKGATGLISGGTTSTTTFAVIMPETATTTKNAFVEVMGVYLAGASSKDIGIQVNSQSARTYVVPASTTSFFKFIYQVDSVNPSNTLVITPQTNTSVYISSARIIVTYAYTP